MNRTPTTHIRTNGKLLLAGEYFVLDGATAFAAPTRFGQDFNFQYLEHNKTKLSWQSIDNQGDVWFEATFGLPQILTIETTSQSIADRLQQILIEAKKLGGQLDSISLIKSTLDFPRTWGLGTSSTLIAALAEQLAIDPFDLLANTFGGSGYDLACAKSETAIFYSTLPKPSFRPVLFDPSFREKIGFIYLGNKQDSRDAIQAYRKKGHPPQSMIQEVSYLAKALSHQDDELGFMLIIEKLETITGNWIGRTPVKEKLFSDFNGAIKSLGAWGGDFIMAVSPQGSDYIQNYFLEQKLHTYLTFDEILK